MSMLVRLDLKKPHQTYRLKSGEKVPGVTTILRELNKPELVQWAAFEERSGILAHMGTATWDAAVLKSTLPANDKGDPAYFCNLKRDKAADLGTITHERIRAWHHGTDVDPEGLDPELFKQSEIPLGRFVSRVVGLNYKTIATEHEMVSEAQRVGGTLDWLYEDGDRLIYEDYKTSKAGRNWPYRDTLAQAAQYAKMYAEIAGRKVDEVRINRIGKEPGDQGQIYVLTDHEREHGEALFEAARLAYEATFQLRK